MKLLKVGDWVKGRSFNDERIRGYIEFLDSESGLVKVRVIQSDREEAVGRVVETSLRRVEKLSVEILNREEEVLSLIDIALQIEDKDWFMKLTTILKQMRQAKKEEEGNQSFPNFQR